jgi:hypothetical protein
MNYTPLTRLVDIFSIAATTVFVVAIGFSRWWLVLAGLLLLATAIGLYIVQAGRGKSSKSD